MIEFVVALIIFGCLFSGLKNAVETRELGASRAKSVWSGIVTSTILLCFAGVLFGIWRVVWVALNT